jgi:hypothetical protein
MDENLFKRMKKLTHSLSQIMAALSALSCVLVSALGPLSYTEVGTSHTHCNSTFAHPFLPHTLQQNLHGI